ncbi:hypothetical protein [Streptomyces sp. AJS327]|uniref:hypothetical protein n=1 Tax=Streptomyces sp. AJS327 TaxID=2545265 RepID=UPI001C60D566|nr:hypothetical protein [Streptomyces sp. AJS327]
MTGPTLVIFVIALLMLLYILFGDAHWLRRRKDRDHRPSGTPAEPTLRGTDRH